jgi:hypothetical protein
MLIIIPFSLRLQSLESFNYYQLNTFVAFHADIAAGFEQVKRNW